MPREIPLTQGKVAIVDEADYQSVSRWKWYAVKGKRTFYAARTVNFQDRAPIRVAMHRFILGEPAGMFVDHRDGNGLDNRRANLRLCNCQDNARNRPSHRGSSSRFKGVSFHKVTGKWSATIYLDRKARHLGLFATEEAAAKRYDAEARTHFGEFARLNFPEAA